MDGGEVNRDTILATERRIAPHIRRPPVITVAGVDFGIKAGSLALKLELMQHSGSFKGRGAFANLLMREVPGAGVVAASGGNHGVAVAYAATKLGIRAKIFGPRVASREKEERIRADGAALGSAGGRCADAPRAS